MPDALFVTAALTTAWVLFELVSLNVTVGPTVSFFTSFVEGSDTFPALSTV